MRHARALSLAIFLLGCATAGPPASGPVDWEAATDSWSSLIVTRDADGGLRVTRIWLDTLDGHAVLRTGDSRWWSNLERDPSCFVRVDGVDHAALAEPVTDRATKVRIDEVFLEKYGWQERLLFPQERGETHENYAWLRAVR